MAEIPYIALPRKLWPVFLAAHRLERRINPGQLPFDDRRGRRACFVGNPIDVMVRLGGVRDILDRIYADYGCPGMCAMPEGRLPTIPPDAAGRGFPVGLVGDLEVFGRGLKRQPLKPAAEVGELTLRLAAEIRGLSPEPEQTVMLDSVRGAILFSWRAPFQLGDTEESVLTWLVRLKAATLTELRDKSGCESANKVLRRILTKCPELEPYITMPGAKGRGSYSTLIQLKPAD
jgi:hypothetical protein